VAQSDRILVFDPAGPITQRRLIHCRRAIAAAHRRVHRSYNETAEPFAWTKKRSTNGGSKTAVSLNRDSGY
jgi:hypothetical protein